MRHTFVWRFLAAGTFFLLANSTLAACVLPIPDEGSDHLSPPSISGSLVTITDKKITLLKKNGSSNKPQSARLTVKTQYFSADGGPMTPADFGKTQYVSIWFVGCRRPSVASLPEAAIVMLGSR